MKHEDTYLPPEIGIISICPEKGFADSDPEIMINDLDYGTENWD